MGLYPLRQILIRNAQHAWGIEALDDLDGVGGCAGDIAFGFDGSRGVDIGDNRHARIGLAQHPHVFRRDRSRKRTTGPHIGNQNGFVRRQNFRGLGHEVHAGLHDDLGIDASGFFGELQTVTAEIGDAVEDLRRHVVVRQDDGVFFCLEFVDRFNQRRVVRPLHRRHDAFDALIHRRHFALESWRPLIFGRHKRRRARSGR